LIARFVQRLAILCFLAVAARSVGAQIPEGVTSLEQSFHCPIDDESWKQRMETSTRATGLRLDLRKLGNIVQPATLPQCPKCRFVLFSEQLEPEILAKLKKFITGGDYQALAQKSPSYASLAQIQEFLGAGPLYVGYSFLRASWQVEEKPALCARYLARAYEHFTVALKDMPASHRDRLNVLLLCGELERRLERWEDADRRFRELQDSEDFKKEPRMAPIISMQLKLIGARDSQPHALNVGGNPSPQAPLTITPPAPSEAETPPPPAANKPLDLSKPLTLDAGGTGSQ
jgi:hypothetical protein